MATFDILATILSISVGISINYAVGNPKYWNMFIVILIYCVITALMHFIMRLYCLSYVSGPDPKHLIVIIAGYVGHFERYKGIQKSFKQYFEAHNKNINENIIVHLIRCNGNGFFCYTFYNTNDGIHKGGKRVSNEMKSIINLYPSINKLSIVGCSLGGIYGRYCLSLLFDSNKLPNTFINNQQIQLMNFISLSTPHTGIADKFTEKSCCCQCCQCNVYNMAVLMSKFHCYPKTLKELLLLDDDNLLTKIAVNQEFLEPLNLFQNRMCYGNGKNDDRVSHVSSLILNNISNSSSNLGEQYWQKMINENNKILIEEFTEELTEENVAININDTNADNNKLLVSFEKLRNEIKWRRIMVCFDFEEAHHRLNNPTYAKSETSKPFFTYFLENFLL